MRNSMRYIIGIVLILFFIPSAFANERAVLLPLSGPLTPDEKTNLSQQIAEVLESKYTVVFGQDVDRVVKQVFLDESHKSECDESRCYRRISEYYQADKIIAFRVTKVTKSRYLITYNLYDVPTGEVAQSRSQECKECSFEKLKLLSSSLISIEKIR